MHRANLYSGALSHRIRFLYWLNDSFEPQDTFPVLIQWELWATGYVSCIDSMRALSHRIRFLYWFNEYSEPQDTFPVLIKWVLWATGYVSCIDLNEYLEPHNTFPVLIKWELWTTGLGLSKCPVPTIARTQARTLTMNSPRQQGHWHWTHHDSKDLPDLEYFRCQTHALKRGSIYYQKIKLRLLFSDDIATHTLLAICFVLYACILPHG